MPYLLIDNRLMRLAPVQPVSYISLALTFTTGAGVFYYYDSRRQAKQAGSLLSLLPGSTCCTAAQNPKP